MRTTLVLAGCLLALSVGMTRTALSEGRTPDPQRVRRQVQEWQATPEERRLDRIGWARDIRDALRLAKSAGRPVFLFTHDGRMNTGRC